jgi:PEP-CTERM motif
MTCADTNLFDESTPYGYYYQGKTADWKISVEPAPVPEPSTFGLFGIGMFLFLAIARQKRNRQN